MSRSLLQFTGMIINVSSFRSNQGQKSRRNVCCSVIIPTEKMRPPSFSISFNGNPFRHLVLMIVDAVESFLLQETPILPKTIDPKVQISGNFSPVPESPPKYKSDITGRIPDAIRGVYVRNGANPLFVPSTGHHLFDGDGMIHIVSFAGDNSVTYGCRYTLTNRLKHEMSMGRGLFPKPIGQLHGHSGIVRLLLFYALSIIGLVDISQGTGCANAGLVYFNGRLLALSEDDLPYNVKITRNGDLETNGRYDFGKQLKSNMIAHPKIDSSTGEMFALSYDPVKKPYLRYFKFDSDGTKSDEIEIPLEKPTMIHDMAITKNYVVIPDHQIVFNLSDMLSGGSPLHLDSSKTSRFGVLPKYATEASEIKWINVPGCFCFHLWNAYEESTPDSSKEIIVIGSCMSPPDSILTDREEEIKITLTEIRLNLNSDTYQIREIVKDWNLEVGHVNPMFLGRKTRFAYLAIAEPWPKCSGIAKVDLVSGKVTKFFYGNQRYGGEPEFVPIATASQIPNIVDDGDFPNANEDDGYLLSFVHDEEVGESELLIFNARNMEQEACVKLHTRVPYGFHGTFVKYEDLQNQLI